MSLPDSSEKATIVASTSTYIDHWHFENDTTNASIQEELWNSGSISLAVTASTAGEGSRVFRITVGEEEGSNIGLNQNESD